MSNPYEASQTPDAYQPNTSPSEFKAPAVALIVVSTIAIAAGLFGLVADLLMLVSGAIEQLEEVNSGPISRYTIVVVRTIWGIALLCASAFVLFGAIKMIKGKSYGLAKTATIVAMIPLLGPCCLLGIPFGIWGFIVLNRPHVRQSFQ